MRKLSLIPLAALAIAVPALAHHSFAMFDMKTNVTKTGTVTDFKWTNPHAWMHVEIAGEPWAIEMNQPEQPRQRRLAAIVDEARRQVTVEYHR